MTVQEAIKRINNHNEIHSRKEHGFAVHITEALNMAVEALENNEILKQLVNGEWVDCDKVDVSTGVKRFDVSRTAEGNPDPLSGQKITIKFRLSNYKQPKKPNVHGYREGREINSISYTCPTCNNHIHIDQFCKHCGQVLDWSDHE